ncbi:hypothetical protein CBM2634_U300002 [Cupriavidus taiwanensis]|uniref:Uncharacterized protein n=1 Tax=Cupriavidus taiwanensis TaxID=164546 RepID=A0A375JGN2_9BURK|nr:hypothetical protein CBM2634_U300002 [Cupriavidus taiwanensis]
MGSLTISGSDGVIEILNLSDCSFPNALAPFSCFRHLLQTEFSGTTFLTIGSFLISLDLDLDQAMTS